MIALTGPSTRGLIVTLAEAPNLQSFRFRKLAETGGLPKFPSGSESQLLQNAVLALFKERPSSAYDEIVEALRVAGWADVNRSDVSRVLTSGRTLRAVETETKRTGKNTKRSQTPFGKAQPGRIIRSDTCPSCGTPITLTGTCRCS